MLIGVKHGRMPSHKGVCGLNGVRGSGPPVKSCVRCGGPCNKYSKYKDKPGLCGNCYRLVGYERREIVRKLVKKYGTQRAVASKLGVSPQNISTAVRWDD